MIIDMHTHPYDESVRRLPLRTRSELATRKRGAAPARIWGGGIEEMRLVWGNRSVVFGPFGNNDWTCAGAASPYPHRV
jgi:hypothetical protein